MKNKNISQLNLIKGKKFTSLSRGLMLWFLLLSLLPVSIVSWISYQQASTGLTKAAISELSQSAALNQNYIFRWFKYRFMDVNSQAENGINAELLMTFKKSWKESGKPLKQFLKSYQWTMISQEGEGHLLAMARRYDYIYDMFLIDIEGNILYSVAHESDLGTNILTGPYAKTKFAKTVKNTIKTGETSFSDLERYAPSENIVTGFITAPLLDEFGVKIGVFAIQIQVQHIIDIFMKNIESGSSLVHYIVGEDGKLRSTMEKNKQDEVLTRKINSKQFQIWSENHKKSNALDSIETTAFSYVCPYENAVIGIQNDLRLPSVNWVLISEIDESEALAIANWLAKMTLFMLFMVVIIVVLMATYQSRRITKPIVNLMKASRLVAAGEIDQKVEIISNNEIGQLAEAFNYMLAMRQLNDKTLEEKSNVVKAALSELDEQKFAMDQHAIVAVANLKGDITYVNDKFSQISGYSEAELLGSNHRLLNSGYHEKSFFIDMYQIISSGKVWHGEVCNRAKNGALYWVDTTIVPSMDENDKPKNYVAIRTDITQRKASEADLIVALEEAKIATQVKSDFLANMSHEIRTPMNGVIGMTGLLLGTELEPKQRGYAENTMKSADALLTIINDILDFSKIEAGKMELESVPLDLRVLSEDVAELMALKCREKNIEMLIRYKPGSEHKLLGDPGRIRQILLNLLSNAVKFTDKGCVVLSVETFPVTPDNCITVLVKVQDTGLGIDKDKIEKIFNKFDQEDSSVTRKYGGTGLGLAICRQLCILMEGNITVDSVKGEGSTFSFTMNLEVDVNTNSPLVETIDGVNLKGLKTLIVDDLEIARTVLEEQLSEIELNIDSVGSGEDALVAMNAAIIAGSPYDIVITDYYMPKMDGECLALEIKRQNILENGILVYVTSVPREGDVNRLSSQNFDAYLTKPTHVADFPEILSLAWHAKQEKKSIPLITRYTIQKASIDKKNKLILDAPKILVVEDNSVNLMVATEYLEGYGCVVTPAGNGIEALAQLSYRKFDLIFMDCQMPEMDGFEATIELRKRETVTPGNTRIPVVAFTANAMQGDKENCLAAGMDDFMSKPISEVALQNTLKKWLPYKVSMTENDEGEKKKNESLVEEIAHIEQEPSDKEKLNISAYNELKVLFSAEFPVAIAKHNANSLKNIELIKMTIGKSDFKAAERAAHSIKGAGGQFGALALAACAEKIENYAHKENKVEIERLLPKLSEEQKAVAILMVDNI